MNKILAIFTILFAFNMQVSGQKPDLKIASTSDFEITGDGSSKNWETVDWFDVVQQTESSVSYQTRAKSLYSETGMYFLVECEDKKLSASKSGYMEDLWYEDVVEVFLWTDENYPIYFEYEISALNEELVLIVPNFDGDFLGWIPWHYTDNRKVIHKTSVQGGKKEPKADIDSWIAEFFIPFELLKPLRNSPPTSGTEWRMNIYRMDYDTGERIRWEWKPIERTFHEYLKFGRVVFE